MRRAFITGIGGQDGSYLADRLVDEGMEVHGLARAGDTDSAAVVERHPDVALHVGDLGDERGLAGLIAEISPDEIYNLAGISSVAQSWREPVATARVTGVAVATILEAAFQLPHPVRVFQASSSEIFGTPPHSPQDETTPLAPSSPYGTAKAFAHHQCRIYRARGLFVATGILYNHESPRRPETFVTRKITAAAARIAAGLQDRLELGDLTVERDWGWAPDYVDAMVRAIRHKEPSEYVIATGESHSLTEFVATAFAAAGIEDWQSRVTTDATLHRPNEISSMRGDAARARTVLGWAPTVAFRQLVERMVAADVDLLAAGRPS